MNTQDYWIAIGGEGPHADTWNDKKHRLVYDLCAEIDRLHRELPTTVDGEIITLGMEVWILCDDGQIRRIQVDGMRLCLASYSLLNSKGVDAYSRWAFSTEGQAKHARPGRLTGVVCRVQYDLEKLGVTVYIKRRRLTNGIQTCLRITAPEGRGTWDGKILPTIREHFPDAYKTSGGYSNRKLDVTFTLEKP